MISDVLKEQCQNLQKIFQNIITVALLDVKDQLSSKNVDMGLHNLQDILERSISAKLQEEEFIASHFREFEQSILESNTLNEQSLLNEKSTLEVKLKKLEEDCRKEVKLKRCEIERLKNELRAKDSICRDSFQGSEGFENLWKELSVAKEYTRRLENDNKKLKSELKSMEDHLEDLKRGLAVGKSYIEGEVNEKRKKDQEYNQNEKKENFTFRKTASKEEMLLQNQDGYNCDKVRKENSEKDTVDITLNLSTLNNQVELLTDQIDELKYKNSQKEDVLDLKEGKIFSLQSTIDKMKIILLECKAKEHNVLLQLNSANMANEKQQKAIAYLRKEREDMQSKFEQNNLKMISMQKEWQKAISDESNKRDKIQRLQNEKKSILNKLKEKSFILSSKDAERDKIKKNLDDIKQRYVKVEKTLIKLTNNYTVLEEAREALEVEKDSLESELHQCKEANENEVAQFMKQLYFLEDDINIEEFTSSVRRLRVAAIAQKIIGKYRNQLATLKSNINQMKESLDISEKERANLQNRLVQKEESSGTIKTKLLMLEEINRQLQLNIADHKGDAKSLQKALQDAVTSYSHVCSLFEKQEMALQKERDNYNSEIANLQTKLKKKSKNSIFLTELPRNADSGVHLSEDLRFMLNDIKNHLSSTLNTMNSKFEKEYAVNNTSFHSKHNDDLILRHYAQSGCGSMNSSIGSNTHKLNEYLKSYEYTSFQCSPSENLTDRTITSQLSMRALSQSEANDTTRDISETIEFANFSKPGSSEISTSQNGVLGNEDDPVKNLQEKLSRLQMMGTDLKSNNIELGEMMKNHSKRLKALKKQTTKNT